MRRTCEITEFGREVKMKLIEKNMTNKELAQKIAMADSTICDVIFGRNCNERTKRIIAENLDMDRTI